MNKVLKTKYGRAKKDKKGYYRITSGKEGNNMKLLHVLIYEEYHGIKIPKGHVVHHIDFNPSNNDISNLEMMTRTKHNTLHNKGKTGNKAPNFNHCIKIRKQKNKGCKQGYYWITAPYANGKKKYISSVNLETCIKKVEDFLNSELNTYGYESYEIIGGE